MINHNIEKTVIKPVTLKTGSNSVAANLATSCRVTYEEMLPPLSPLVRRGFEASGNFYNAIAALCGRIAEYVKKAVYKKNICKVERGAV